MIEAVGGGWRSGPLLVAQSRAQRWRGLRPRPGGRGLVLAARSVHGLGMAEPLGVVSLDAIGRVRRTARLLPGRLFWDLGARWVIEVPIGRGLPQAGALLALRGPFPSEG